MIRRWFSGDRGALTFLCLLPCLWYATPLFTEVGYYLGDLTAQYKPWWTFAHESLREGRLPLWNPHVMGGMPYHVNPENALFYPLKWPLVFLSFFKAAALLRVLNTIVALTGMFLLLRRSMRIERIAAVAGALMFGFGSFMSYKFIHIPYINTAVWFPWQLWMLRRLIRRPDAGSAIGLAVTTALSFLGGSPGIFLVCQMTLGAFATFDVLRLATARRWQRLARGGMWLAVAVVLVLGLTLVLLLPAFEFIRETPRSAGLRANPNYSDFVLTPQGLLALVFPQAHYAFGAPYPPVYTVPFLNVPYAGLAALLLALFHVGSRRHAWLTPPALSIGVVSALLAMGNQTAFFPWLLERVTVLGWFRWPHDYLLMIYLVLPLLAAAGLDRLLRASARTRRTLLVVAAVYLAVGLLATRHPAALVGLVATTAVAFAARGALASANRGGLWRFAGVTLIVLLLADLFVFGSGYRVYTEASQVDPAPAASAIDFVRKHAGDDRVAVAAPGHGVHFWNQERIFGREVTLVRDASEAHRRSTRLDPWLQRQHGAGRPADLWSRREAYWNLGQLFEAYPVNSSMVVGYQEVSGYDPFMIERVGNLYRGVPQITSWNLLGVRWVVTPHRLAHPGLEHAHRGPDGHVYENTTAFPRVVVPRRVEAGLDPETVLTRMASADFDPRELLMLEEGVAEAAAGRAEIVDYRPERIEIDVELDRPGWVLLHEIAHPGWRAFDGAEELEITTGNYAFRAVNLPAGKRRISLVYRPRSLAIAGAISCICWLGCLAFPILRARRASRRWSPAPRRIHAELPST